MSEYKILVFAAFDYVFLYWLIKTGQDKVGSILVLYGTGHDRIAFHHASAKHQILSRSVSTEEGRSATLPPRFRRIKFFVPFRVHRRGPFRYASDEFEILFRSVSTVEYRSAKLFFRFRYASFPLHFFDSLLCPGRYLEFRMLWLFNHTAHLRMALLRQRTTKALFGRTHFRSED